MGIQSRLAAWLWNFSEGKGWQLLVNGNANMNRAALSGHENYMRRALDLARQAEAAGEVPVGCIIVRDDRVIGTGFNQPISGSDPTAHAEIVAMRAAGRALGNYRLTDCTLYVTLEPCAMCAGAMVHARIGRLVYGADDPKAGAAGSLFNLVQSEVLNHRMDMTSGVLAGESRGLLQAFFRGRRKPGQETG